VRSPGQRWQAARWLAALAPGSLLAGAVCAQTTITTDSSWGRTPATLTPSASATAVVGNRGTSYAIPGNVYTIPESQGKLAGANLFHSFQSFSVGSGDAAVFTTTTPTLNNVVSRVSGASSTQIHGLLALLPQNGGAPNFFFINPAGVTFGAGAMVDVPAALHVSTANDLRFRDGMVFIAGKGPDSTLTIAPPEAFGFLGRLASASIRVDNRDANGVASGRTNLLGIGSKLTIAADDVELSSATISVPNGDLLLVATGRDPLEVNLEGTSAHDFTGAIAMTNATLVTSGAGSIRLLGGPMTLRQSSFVGSTQGAQSSVGSVALRSTGDITLDGSFIRSFTSGTNVGGSISVNSAGHLAISGGGQITSVTQSSAPGGSISVGAKSVSIDGVDKPTSYTGILSQAQLGPGNAGAITVHAAEDLRIEDGGVMATGTFSSGSNGPINVEAGSLTINGRNTPAALGSGIFNTAFGGSTGNAGDVHIDVTGGLLSVLNGAEIGSLTLSTGSSGSVTVEADRLIVDGRGNPLPFITGIFTQTSSSGNAKGVQVHIDDDLSLLAGGQIEALTFSKGSNGSVGVKAGSLAIDGKNDPNGFGTGIFNTAGWGSSGSAGDISVDVSGGLTLRHGGEIASGTFSTGSSDPVKKGATGFVEVEANSLEIDGGDSRGVFTGIFVTAFAGSSGDALGIGVDVENDLAILNGGQIAAGTYGQGSNGSVDVEARVLTVNEEVSTSNFTGVFNAALKGSSGDAGHINVKVADGILLLNEGQLSSITESTGSAGNVAVEVTNGSLLIDGPGAHGTSGIFSTANQGSSGDSGNVTVTVASKLSVVNEGVINAGSYGASAGSVKVHAASLLIDAGHIGSQANPGSTGDAGDVSVEVAGQISILNGSDIATSTFSKGSAGDIEVVAGAMLIDSRGVPGFAGGILSRALNERKYGTSSGDAGDIRIQVAGSLSIFYSEISSSTRSVGDAGTVDVTAGSLLLDSTAGIFSQTFAGHFAVSQYGDAGTVKVKVADSLSILGGSLISSNTSTNGHGGSVDVDAHRLLVAGTGSAISAEADGGSSGQTGDLTVRAREGITISHGGALSIRNEATVANPSVLTPTLLFVSAPSITLTDASITAESTGNVDASDIQIRFSDRMVVDPSRISTSANLGDGGAISIEGNGLLWLDHSQITTSVLGASGNGGDISIRAGTLLMETGFIQANTAGTGGRGGNVTIDVQTLLASGGTLLVGGSTPAVFDASAFGLNVIQAAAPDGVSGLIGIAAPVLDIAGKLSGLEAEVIDMGPLGRDLCRVGAGSSLTPVGRGGLRPSAAGLIRPDAAAGLRTAAPGARLPGASQEQIVASAAYDCR
jgi:filamentous hemagglutinin family protein